jgi:hypothetical protein
VSTPRDRPDAPAPRPAAAPETAPRAAPETAPKAAPETARKAAPATAPKTAPEAAPATAPTSDPETASETAPKSDPETAPENSPETAPETGAVIPPEIRELLGPAPLLRGEDPARYAGILAQLAAAVRPRDFVEWIWVRDLVDLGWEAARARAAKTARIAMERRRAMEALWFAQYTSDLDAYPSMKSDSNAALELIFAGDWPDEVAYFHFVLKERFGLAPTAVDDVAYALALADIEKLQRLIDNAGARRDAILREIDRRRESLARRLRQAAAELDEIIDAEFE